MAPFGNHFWDACYCMLYECFFALKAMTRTLQSDKTDVMDRPIEHGCRCHVIAKDLSLAVSGTIGREDYADPLVAAVDHLEAEVSYRATSTSFDAGTSSARLYSDTWRMYQSLPNHPRT